jgi:hypothetical protein
MRIRMCIRIRIHIRPTTTTITTLLPTLHYGIALRLHTTHIPSPWSDSPLSKHRRRRRRAVRLAAPECVSDNFPFPVQFEVHPLPTHHLAPAPGRQILPGHPTSPPALLPPTAVHTLINPMLSSLSPLCARSSALPSKPHCTLFSLALSALPTTTLQIPNSRTSSPTSVHGIRDQQQHGGERSIEDKTSPCHPPSPLPRQK